MHSVCILRPSSLTAIAQSGISCIFLMLASFLYVGAVSYTAYDDASWAVMEQVNLSAILGNKQDLYDSFMEACRSSSGNLSRSECDSEENFRLQMNYYQPRSVYNYTKLGFTKTRAPEDLMRTLKAFWDANRDDSLVEFERPNPYHNVWEAETRMLRLEDAPGGKVILAEVANACRNVVESWTGMRLATTSVFGIRIYQNNSVLAPHVDRLPLVSSVIINVDQDVDEDWVLEVYDHAGVAHNLTMNPGDMILYESHSVIHGRPFPFQGRFYANVFVHFEPIGPARSLDFGIVDADFPPYLMAESSWEPEWRLENPNGWILLKDTAALVEKGDLPTIRYLGTLDKSKLFEADRSGWQLLHEAARHGHLDIIEYLLQQGADVNAVSFKPYLPADAPGRRKAQTERLSPLAVALKYLGDTHPASEYLVRMGGVVTPQIDQALHNEL